MQRGPTFDEHLVAAGRGQSGEDVGRRGWISHLLQADTEIGQRGEVIGRRVRSMHRQHRCTAAVWAKRVSVPVAPSPTLPPAAGGGPQSWRQAAAGHRQPRCRRRSQLPGDDGDSAPGLPDPRSSCCDRCARRAAISVIAHLPVTRGSPVAKRLRKPPCRCRASDSPQPTS